MAKDGKTPPLPFNLSFRNISPNKVSFRAELNPSGTQYRIVSIAIDCPPSSISYWLSNAANDSHRITGNFSRYEGSGTKYDIMPALVPPGIPNHPASDMIAEARTKNTTTGLMIGHNYRVRLVVKERHGSPNLFGFTNHPAGHNIGTSFGKVGPTDPEYIHGTISIVTSPNTQPVRSLPHTIISNGNDGKYTVGYSTLKCDSL